MPILFSSGQLQTAPPATPITGLLGAKTIRITNSSMFGFAITCPEADLGFIRPWMERTITIPNGARTLTLDASKYPGNIQIVQGQTPYVSYDLYNFLLPETTAFVLQITSNIQSGSGDAFVFSQDSPTAGIALFVQQANGAAVPLFTIQAGPAPNNTADMLDFENSAGTVLAKVDYEANAFFPTLSATGIGGSTSPSRYVGATTGGAPASGTYKVGDWAADTSGSFWMCTVAGTPGTWVKIGGSSALLGYNAYTPASQVAYSTNAGAMVAVDTANMTVSFTVPPSGNVFIRLTALMNSSASGGWGWEWALFQHNTTTQIGATINASWYQSQGGYMTSVVIPLTGLTPGANYQVDWAWNSKATSLTLYLYVWGSQSPTSSGAPAVMEVWSA